MRGAQGRQQGGEHGEARASAEAAAQQLNDLLSEALGKLGTRNRVLALPPDITRFHSQAGLLTQAVYGYYGDRLKAVLPAIGTHTPMTPD